jgi:hypothetical protein
MAAIEKGDTNQKEVGFDVWGGIGEERRPGLNVWGGVVSREPGIELKEKKIKNKFVVALDGSRHAKNMQQPTKNTQARRGRDRIRSATVGERRGGCI